VGEEVERPLNEVNIKRLCAQLLWCELYDMRHKPKKEFTSVGLMNSLY